MHEQARMFLQQLGRTARAMYAAFEADVGQPLSRWRILQALQDAGETSQKDLARQLAMDPASMTRQMKTLESEGLIQRRAHPRDHRLTQVALTAAGAALVERARPEREAFSRRALAGLPPDQIEATLALLQVLEQRFKR